MRIVLFHPVLLPPKDYGGVERVVLWLARGLIERGHEVHVAAQAGSRLPPGARLIEIRHPDPIHLSSQLPKGCDVVHFMAPPGVAAIQTLGCASVVSVHGNGQAGEVFPPNAVFVSSDHAKRHGHQAYVWNGIDPGELRDPGENRGSRFLFLSRTAWRVKNVRGAARLCAQADVGLDVAGGWRPFGLSGPVLAGLRPGMRWHGPVNGQRKAALLAQARALVFPIVWDEPFGLVVAESWMSGTPVLATSRGSLPELFEGGGPELGGLLPEPDRDPAAWISALRELAAREPSAQDAARCRAHALARFHYSKMAESYEALYGRVVAGRPIW